MITHIIFFHATPQNQALFFTNISDIERVWNALDSDRNEFISLEEILKSSSNSHGFGKNYTIVIYTYTH